MFLFVSDLRISGILIIPVFFKINVDIILLCSAHLQLLDMTFVILTTYDEPAHLWVTLCLSNEISSYELCAPSSGKKNSS